MIVRMSSEELKIIEISREEIRYFNENFSDPECPEFTDEEFAQFRPTREVHTILRRKE